MAKVGRPKKGSNKLPVWFDIQKYKPMLSFETSDWFEQLELRHGLINGVSWLRNRYRGENFNKLDELLSFMLSQFWNKPIITAAEFNKSACLLFIGSRIHAVNNPSHYPRGVRGAFNSEILIAYETFPTRLKERIIEEEWEEIFNDETQNNFLHSAAQIRRGPIAMIDLSLPDEVLFQEFKEYIKQERRARKAEYHPPFIKNPDYAGWCSCGALPYLDLCLWETVSGECFHLPSFASRLSEILPEAVSEGVINKTTKPLAEKLIMDTTRAALLSQAHREKFGALKKSGRLLMR